MTTIRVPDVCERDIDLLLLEEFVASPEFRAWFLSQIGVEKATDLIEACRSVKTMNGESDLELTFHSGSGLLKILIENKVDAAFQPNQPQRYAERAEGYMALETYREVMTVVMAPEVYFGDEGTAFGFDAKVTYEGALAWFKQTEIGARKDYKLAILRGAIDRARRGWKLVPHRGVSDFWRAYWELCEEIAPQLSMPVPKAEIPADSHFIAFRTSLLPAGVSLWHKVAYGHVDLQFEGMGERLSEMEQLYRSLLLPSMRIERAAKSAVIRVRVNPVDMATTSFSNAETFIRRGIEAAILLLGWYSEVQKVAAAEQANNGLQGDAPQAARP